MTKKNARANISMRISLIRIFSPPETQVFKLLSKIYMVKKKKKGSKLTTRWR